MRGTVLQVLSFIPKLSISKVQLCNKIHTTIENV